MGDGVLMGMGRWGCEGCGVMGGWGDGVMRQRVMGQWWVWGDGQWGDGVVGDGATMGFWGDGQWMMGL